MTSKQLAYGDDLTLVERSDSNKGLMGKSNALLTLISNWMNKEPPHTGISKDGSRRLQRPYEKGGYYFLNRNRKSTSIIQKLHKQN